MNIPETYLYGTVIDNNLSLRTITFDGETKRHAIRISYYDSKIKQVLEITFNEIILQDIIDVLELTKQKLY